MYTIEYLTKALKKAREDKRLSQRALSQRVGMPQAQISRIENSAVDLRTSNLIGLARALDLEVMLIPRKYVPAVTSITKEPRQEDGKAFESVYSLKEADDDA
jgi:HTH-type transcriptional regulator/antitoxin HipB